MASAAANSALPARDAALSVGDSLTTPKLNHIDKDSYPRR